MDDRLGVLWGEEQGWGRAEAPEGTSWLLAHGWRYHDVTHVQPL